MQIIEVDDVTYRKIIDFCDGREIASEIYALILWAEEQMTEAPAKVKTINRYYDVEKYKATAKADLRRISQEDPEDL